jgi:hypothetical protein
MMLDFDTRQSAFAAAVLHADRPVPPGLIGPDGEPGTKRFAVYRNNVVAGLGEALKAAFPATCRIVGDAFFAAMARAYVVCEPPRSPIMLSYGAGFADFVGAFEPAKSLPYLRDIARLERAWAEAYHACDATPLDPAAFASLEPEQLPSIALVLHPSARVVRSSFPVVTLWQMNIDGGVPTAIDIDAGGEDAFVARPIADVEVRVLPPGAAAFVESLAAGAPMMGAVEAALADDRRFDLAGTLTVMMDAGVVTGWKRAGVPVPDNAARRA